jgi:FtsZ-interacting cell division protein ZipA
MNNKMKKWLTVIGCLAICAVLVVLIGQQFKSPKPVDNPHPPQSSEVSDVTVEPSEPDSAEKGKEVVVTPPDTSQPVSTDNGAVSSGTEQTIQGDVSKPEYTEEQLQDSTQKPNGEKVTEPPTAVDHDKVEQPKETPKSESQPQGGETKDGKIYVPGFGWIDDIGDGQGTTVDGDGDINKRVGIMD